MNCSVQVTAFRSNKEATEDKKNIYIYMVC